MTRSLSLDPAAADLHARHEGDHGDDERVEAAAGDLLGELGYTRAFPRPTPAAVEHAERLRWRFAEEARARGARVPRRWEEAG